MSATSQNKLSRRKQSAPNATVFSIDQEAKIPGRHNSIRPNESRATLYNLPARRESAKITNMASRSIRQALIFNARAASALQETQSKTTGGSTFGKTADGSSIVLTKENNFKCEDYQFMKQLRADNGENRENMTITLTRKLLENKRKGNKESIVDIARKVSMNMIKGSKAGKTQKDGVEASDQEDEE